LLRLPREIGDDSLLHTALLAYASDYLLMDMVLRSHPERIARGSFVGFSLDHALWFHRPVRLNRWHSYTQRAQALSGHRGLVRGLIHDIEGHLVASVMQENLVRGTE
jgi:acyl-CoA thioesterase-2